MDWTKIAELIASALVTLGAAYLGAKFAYRFNTSQQKLALRVSRVEECNRAMLALYQQFNTLNNYRDQTLAAFRDSPGRHLQVRASTTFNIGQVSVNPAALAFLISTEAQQVPSEIALLQARFQACLELINHRSAIHLSEYQPKLEAEMIRLGVEKKVSGEVIEQAVGTRIVLTLHSATNTIYEHVYDTIDAYANAGIELQKLLKIVFPEAKIMGFTTDSKVTKNI